MADARFPLEDYFGFDIRPFAGPVRFEAGDIILSEGEANEALFFLQKGRVKVSATQPNGKLLIISFIDAPAFLGELEFLGARELTNGVTAVLPCACWRIDGGGCRERILNDATFLRKLCVMQGRRFVQNAEKSAQSQSYPLKARLARFILQAAPDGVYREKHTEAAAYLGVTYRHYLYVLANLVDRGILEKTPQGYHIRDREGQPDGVRLRGQCQPVQHALFAASAVPPEGLSRRRSGGRADCTEEGGGEPVR